MSESSTSEMIDATNGSRNPDPASTDDHRLHWVRESVRFSRQAPLVRLAEY